MRCDKAVIIHGIGTGVLRKTAKEVLSKNKYVVSAKIDIFNEGETIVELKKR